MARSTKFEASGAPAAHGGDQTRVADCFGKQARVLALLGEAACGSDRFTSLAHEESIGEIIGVSQPTAGGLRRSERLLCQFRGKFEMATSLVEASCTQIELGELAMGFDESPGVRSYFKNFLSRKADDRMLAAIHRAACHCRTRRRASGFNIGGPDIKRPPDEG